MTVVVQPHPKKKQRNCPITHAITLADTNRCYKHKQTLRIFFLLAPKNAMSGMHVLDYLAFGQDFYLSSYDTNTSNTKARDNQIYIYCRALRAY